MSCSSGPNASISDGLILYLDALNKRSYPGTGTIWYDISGNGYDATIVNGAVFNNNRFTFDGISQYIQVSQVTNFKSFIMICKPHDPNTAWHYLLDARPGWGSGYFAHTTDWTPGGWLNTHVNGVPTALANVPLDTNMFIYAEANALYTSEVNLYSRYSNAECMAGDIYAFLMFDRNLTPEEQLQISNTLSHRFNT